MKRRIKIRLSSKLYMFSFMGEPVPLVPLDLHLDKANDIINDANVKDRKSNKKRY